MTISPVLFLIFNRPDTTALVMEAIRAARPSRLYIGADGPRDRPGEAVLSEEARRIATAVDWPCQVFTLFSDHNLGPRKAVSSAISWFFENEDEGIILEDDCLPSADFFHFCDELLERFRTDSRIMAICGSCYATPAPWQPESYYFSYYADMWGWATWRRAWQLYDSDLSRWPAFKKRRGLEALSRGKPWHEIAWGDLFDAAREGRIVCWDYQWIYTVIEQAALACYPVRNTVSNLGFRPDATHTLVECTNQTPGPPANLPHERLEFPLVHPSHFARSAAMDEKIEVFRLGFTPPGFVSGATWTGRLHQSFAIKRIVRKLLGETALGMIDYYRHPDRRVGWGGPFNGQKYRTALFLALIKHFSPVVIVETGTYYGVTTELFAETQCPVYSVEADKRAYGFARVRLSKRRNVTLLRGDSRHALRRLLEGPVRCSTARTLFFYLDAHWNADVPLAEELEIIYTRCPAAIVMIDDCEVPFDSGYGYDDYGPGKALTESYIAPLISKFQLQTFYPSTASKFESGARRGCVVMVRRGVQADALAQIPLLCHTGETEFAVRHL